MRRITKITAAVAAGGAVVGSAAVAVPAFAGNGPGPSSRPPAYGQMMRGYQAGRVGHGPGDGICLNGSTAAAGTLTSAQKTALASMAEEERLAHDLYAAFASRYGAAVFDRIAAAESRHLEAVRNVLASHGLADPTAGKAAGVFASTSVQATYDRLLAQGKVSQDAALRAGQAVERADIADLTAALDGLTAANVRQLYTNLAHASQMHLNAFGNWLSR